MPDIIVTTPKSQIANAAQEAADVIADGGGEYFRRFPIWQRPIVNRGDRVYYVEAGWVRGFAVVQRAFIAGPQCCETTARMWGQGYYIIMDAATWQWIKPIRMTGFQGFRVAEREFNKADVQIVGGWLDPKPAAPGESLPLLKGQEL